MQRIYNEMTSSRRRKAMGGRGGIKMGDFGSGGRVYSTDYVRPAGSGSGAQCNPSKFGLASCLCTVIPLIALIVTERSLFQTAGCIEEAGENAVTCESPYVLDHNEGSLIFVTSDPRHSPTLKGGTAPRDPYFNYQLPSEYGIGKRVTEYCQWAEMRHSQNKKTGRKTEKGDDIYTTEVWYTYHKAWRNRQVNSLFFDNPAAYHNPQRNPAPSTPLHAKSGIDLSGNANPAVAGLSISSSDMAPAMQNWQRLPIAKAHTVAGVGSEALRGGFSEADHQYYYSRKPKNGWNNPLVQAGMSYLVDGILDVNSISSATGIESLLGKAGLGWITKGTCEAGDVRVHFEGKRLPKSVSLVGQQMGGTVVPMMYSNGQAMLLIQSGVMSLESLLKISLSDANFWQNVYRGCVLLFVVVGGICFEHYSNFQDPDWVLGLGLGGTVFSVLFTVLQLFFYGVDDSYVALGMLVGSVGCLGAYIVSGSGGGGKSKTL